MIKPRFLRALTLLLLYGTDVYAQEPLLDEFPALRDKAMVLQINTKVEENSQELWNAFNSKVTIPGRPVGIKLVGDNLIIALQFTPYLRQGKYALVIQSQIWINVPEKGMSYKTNTHSIPVDFDEPILYLPLGVEPAADTPRIELRLTIYRYGEEPVPEETAENKPKPVVPEEATSPAEPRGENKDGAQPPRGQGQAK